MQGGRRLGAADTWQTGLGARTTVSCQLSPRARRCHRVDKSGSGGGGGGGGGVRASSRM